MTLYHTVNKMVSPKWAQQDELGKMGSTRWSQQNGLNNTNSANWAPTQTEQNGLQDEKLRKLGKERGG
ncbi:hypothetical protein KC19_7G127900 [Ceratodon purpureus]|uniref:Uncharacterized protein n=1 Tax=Ceratodon purpureus TaxID=3225 RepID=A0A8T0H5Z4_CERPU|nr:hypothetical protein KC19_7G127900 [Ceratodon purpureus]